MPSHIYTRLGMWEDSIASNLASAGAARAYTAAIAEGAAWYDELHALDYLAFAYLQTAQDARAAEVVGYVRGLTRFHQSNFIAAYAIGAIPARYALERGRWREAATLELVHEEVLAPFPFAVAHVEFARAVGAARSGDPAAAAAAKARLGELRQTLSGGLAWWKDQLEIQELAAAGWIAHASGLEDEARRQLEAAVALEGKAGTHPVTPGQVIPASEQLGDLLLELDRPAEALGAYEQALVAFPQRLNGHRGAAQAAARAGRDEAARRHWQAVIGLAGAGDGRRELIEQARAYLAAPAAKSGEVGAE